MKLVKVASTGLRFWAVERDGGRFRLAAGLDSLLAMPLDAMREACAVADEPVPADLPGCCPIDSQEVWAAGVTYRRSRDGRTEESGFSQVYQAVYTADRPELFFKSTAGRVVGPGEPIGIRHDSDWDVPEPEAGLVVNSAGQIAGYVVGNDVSSRSIEGANPLYLPQAKVYQRSCAIGPCIVPSWELDAGDLTVSVRVEREGRVEYAAEVTTAAMRRTFDDLVSWLTHSLDFPVGVILLTGTGVVPGAEFTLAPGDVVSVGIAGIGTLTNPVVRVGRATLPGGSGR